MKRLFLAAIFVLIAVSLLQTWPSTTFADYTPVYSDGHGCVNMDSLFSGSVRTELDAKGNYSYGMATITIPTGACPEIITFASYQHNGTLLPYEDQKLFDYISAWYGPGTHQIGPLRIACNFQTDLYFGSVVSVWPKEGAIVIPGPGVGGSVYIAANAVEHQVCAPPPSSSDKLSCSIAFDKNPIDKGGETIIHWTSSGARLFYIKAIGYVSSSGSTTVAPSQTTDYSGYVNDAADEIGNTFNCPATLTVSGTQCPIGQVLQNGVCVVQCPGGYVEQNGECVFSACPSGYILQGTSCIVSNLCATPPLCSGNDLVNSCTGALIQSCAFGCASGACNPPPALSATLNASPSLLHAGNTTAVSWSATNADSCTVHGSNGNSWGGTSSSGHMSSPSRGRPSTRSTASRSPALFLHSSTRASP